MSIEFQEFVLAQMETTSFCAVPKTSGATKDIADPETSGEIAP